MRLDSKIQSKDQIFLNESNNEIIFSNSQDKQNIIFSENVNKYLLLKELTPEIENNEYNLILKKF